MFLKVRNYSLNPPGLLKVYSNKMKMKYISVAYFTICNECENIFFSHFSFYITIVDVSCLR